jgi:hypothetical protein
MASDLGRWHASSAQRQVNHWPHPLIPPLTTNGFTPPRKSRFFYKIVISPVKSVKKRGLWLSFGGVAIIVLGHERGQGSKDVPVEQRMFLMPIFRGLAVWVIIAGLARVSAAALVVNPPLPISHALAVQFIGVADDDGSNAAPMLGNPVEQTDILNGVSTIWSQAGIALNYSFRAETFNNTFANSGTLGSNNPRPEGDLDATFALAAAAGDVLSADPQTLNILFVNIVPLFSALADNQGAGLAFLGANGMSLWAGPDLPGSETGREGLAKLIAHEIGHNLGLDHLTLAQNLMQDGGASNPGQRISPDQIPAVLNSPFLVPVPEPASATLFLLASIALLRLRRRAANR